jgi:uncharacterized membrane protein YdjX (TVP38/TMEM64 family)
MVATSTRGRWLRFAAGLLFLIAVLVVLFGGFAEGADATQIRQWLLDLGWWGPLVFLVAFALLQPVGVAAHVFILAAALVWPPFIALPLSLGGAVAAGCVAFGFARFVGFDWVQARLPDKVKGYDEALIIRGFRTVLVLRLTMFTFGPMQLMLGVSKVRFGPYVAGTALGLLPLIAVETFAGASLVDFLFG